MDPIVLSEPQKADIKFITTLEDESACADPPRVARTPLAAQKPTSTQPSDRRLPSRR
jgi:hypothetical protein